MVIQRTKNQPAKKYLKRIRIRAGTGSKAYGDKEELKKLGTTN
jgi:hypothetical protein